MVDELWQRINAVEEDHWWFRGRRTLIDKMLSLYLPTHSILELLDVGAGSGKNMTLLTPYGRVQGLDPFPQNGTNIIKGRAENLPFVSGRFDSVTAFDVLEHIEDEQAALQEMIRVLKPKGFLFLTVPAGPHLWSDHDVVNGHYRRYTKETLQVLLNDASLQLLKLTYFNTLLYPLAAFSRKWRHRDDLKLPPLLLNHFLERVFTLEASLLATRDLPYGLSLLAVAKLASTSSHNAPSKIDK